MVMSPGGRRVSWLFFKARAKRPYLDSYGSSPAAAGRKKSQLAAARRVALKMGRLGETYRRIGVSACRRVGVSACRRFAKHHQLRRDLLVIIAVSQSSPTSPHADT